MREGSEVLAEGDVVAGRYAVEGRIGKGGMGAVYAAFDKRLGRRVALKALASRFTRGPARHRLEAEARAVAALAHDGIVTLFDVVDHDAELVLVMELVTGESLRAALTRGAFTPPEAAELIAGVADALGAAHAVGLVHRDVKPDNVMLRADGRTKLLDFGVATAIAPEETDPSALTVSAGGQLVGTPAYLSPEQILGEKVTPATDQFALAVTAYELMTGRLPWRSNTLALLASDILNEPPMPLSSRSGASADALEAVFQRALQKSPGDRFPTIGELGAALLAATGGAREAPSAPQTRVAVDVPPAFDPYSATLVGSSGDDLDLGRAAGGARGDGGAPPAHATRASAEPVADPPEAGGAKRTSRRGRWLAPLAVLSLTGALAAGAFFARSPRTPAPTPATTPTPVASAAPSAMTPIAALPASPTQSDLARARYEEGVANLGSGASDRGREALDEAIHADPTFASALLQRAYDSFRRAAALDEAGRAAFRGAVSRRDALSPRDGELLDAITPAFGDPPDWAKTGERLEAFVARRPGDEQGWDALAMSHVKRNDFARAEVEYARVLEINPKATVAYLIRAQIRLFAGELAQGRAILGTCLDVVPEAQRCRHQLALSLLRNGECAEAERVAREMTALMPNDPAGYSMRAQAAAGLGAPDDAIADLLRQQRDATPEAGRPVQALIDAQRLAMRRGDFDRASEALAQAADLVGASNDELLGEVIVARVRTEWEAGRSARAAKIAAAFVAKSAARKAPERMLRDATPQLFNAMYEGGLLDHDAWVREREGWLATWKARSSATTWKESAPYAWMLLHGLHDPSARDAEEAMRARAELFAEPLATSDPNLVRQLAPVGATLIAAGRDREAEPMLRRASRDCAIEPEVRATYLLGVALEHEGDTRAACDAYAEVERRWGKAKPTSVTARAARHRAAACPLR